MDPYRPEEWHDFFLMIGGGAAALTGLVAVAMSLHLDVIVHDSALRHGAQSILTGLASAFMRCGLVLMGGQNGQAVAAELFVVCAIGAWLVIASFAQVGRAQHSVPRGSVYHTIGGIGCYVVEMIGATVLFAGYLSGLWIAAVAMVAHFYFTISGSWLLLVGVTTDEAASNAVPLSGGGPGDQKPLITPGERRRDENPR